MGWSYRFWKENFYPREVPAKDFLAFYARHYNTVEVDSTFYRIPRVQVIEEWKSKTHDDFAFSLKFPQMITHLKMLKDCQEETRVFLDRVNLLGEKMGVLLLQFPPKFGKQHLSFLREYLRMLPETNRYAVEVRNKSLLNDDVYALLREHTVALAWVDTPKMPLINEVTADFVYIRWEGDRKTVTGTLGKTEINQKETIRTWAAMLKPLVTKGTEVFGYFSKYFSGYPPGDAKALMEVIAKSE